MNRCCHQGAPDSHHRRGHSSRRGALFHYYLVYLLLTGAVMAAAGVALHASLRSDHADANAAIYLLTLQRLDRQLRQDAAEAISIRMAEGRLVCELADPDSQLTRTATWSVNERAVQRMTAAGTTEAHHDRFAFAPGTVLSLTESPDGRVVLQIQEPSPHAGAIGQRPEPSDAQKGPGDEVDEAASGSDGVAAMTVELHVYTRNSPETPERPSPPESGPAGGSR